jgi:hypothetical protein
VVQNRPRQQCTSDAAGQQVIGVGMMGKTITKDDYNHLVELYNRRSKFDVIGVSAEEHRALGKVLDILHGMLPTDASTMQTTNKS